MLFITRKSIRPLVVEFHFTWSVLRWSGRKFLKNVLDEHFYTYLIYYLLALSGDLLVYSFEVREDSEGKLW